MTRGIFRGIEDGNALIESCGRVVRLQVAGDIRCVQWGFGYHIAEWRRIDNLPEVGQEVDWEPATPDMAGHLVAWIGPIEEVA